MLSTWDTFSPLHSGMVFAPQTYCADLGWALPEPLLMHTQYGHLGVFEPNAI